MYVNLLNNMQNLELLKIKNGKIEINTNVFTGKEGDYFIVISPAFNISGYGSTIDEAEVLFKACMDDFCESLLSLSHDELSKEMAKLGFDNYQEEYSKTFVDSNGELTGFQSRQLVC